LTRTGRDELLRPLAQATVNAGGGVNKLSRGPFSNGARVAALALGAALFSAQACKARSSSFKAGSTPPGDAAGWLTAPQVPAPIAAPSDAKLLAHFHATGAQVYVCRLSPQGAPAWTLKAPDATLFDAGGNDVGSHGGGPSWSLKDGSRVSARKVAQVNAPDSAAIPWLLLQVTSATGNGLLSSATHVHRVQTARGMTPVGGCLGATMDSEVRIDYAAEYYFYSAGAAPPPDAAAAH